MRPIRAFLISALLATGLLAIPASAGAVEKMFWRDSTMTPEEQFPLLKQLHVDVFQDILNWSSTATSRPAKADDPSDPAYGWPEYLDKSVAQARANGMSTAIMLFGAPEWANGNRGFARTPNRTADFAAFARAAARRYPDNRLWMIWGEPCLTERFEPLTRQRIFGAASQPASVRQGPRAYAKLVDAAYGALKSISPANKVIAGMSTVTCSIRPGNWVKYMRLPNGKPPRMDLYGHNPFGARRPDLRNRPSIKEAVDFSDLGRFQKVVNRYLAKPRGKRSLRFFLSEYTIPTGPDGEFNYYATPALQASWIKSAFSTAHKLNAYGLGWIHLRDTDKSRSGLITLDGKPKPGFAAFRAAR